MEVNTIKCFIDNFFFENDIDTHVIYQNDYVKDDDQGYTEFVVDGLKRWKFGEIIYQLKDGSWSVQLFGEHADYIDKFKSDRTMISFKFILKDNDFQDDNLYIVELSDFIEEIQMIQRQPLAMKYYFYGDTVDSKLWWLIKEFWFYRIEFPIRKFLETQGNYFIANCLKLYINLFYKKAIDSIYVLEMFDNCSPTVNLRINIKDEYIDTIGYKLWKRFGGRLGFSRYLDVDICQYLPDKSGANWKSIYWKE